MAKKVLIVDTSILCVWLKIPGREVIKKKDKPAIKARIKEEVANNTHIVLPFASIIECGNHITQIKRKDSQKYVNQFAEFIEKAIDGKEPWDIFTNQSVLFTKERLKEMVCDWKQLSVTGLSMGDVSIKQVASHYDSMGYTAEIFTSDEGLKAYQPSPKPNLLTRNHNRR
ncbi:MAG: hypothetical protein HDR88_08320 [Bacteroides sp.]|nr:hypothetical protein [Bacteroides sp.]